MAKTDFFRVAVEGRTIDGREITRDMIDQMAASYDRATYTARINCEHISGYSPNGPFNAWGDVDALKADTVDVNIGGKTEQRRALFARLDVTDQAIGYNRAGQKVFPSMEVSPNFSGTGKPYLIGFAVTDTPASIATQAMKFSARADTRKDDLLIVGEDAFVIAAAADPTPDASAGAFAAMKTFFDGLLGARGTKPEDKPDPKPEEKPGTSTDFSAFATGLGEQLQAMGDGIQKNFSAMEARIARVDADQKALAAALEDKPGSKYSARPQSTGGTGAPLAEC